MNTLQAEPRHGKTRLCLVINDDVYACRKVSGKIRLKKISGYRPGSIYYVSRGPSTVTCTCPDAWFGQHGPDHCKHVGAVLACKLLPRPRKEVARA